MTPGPKPIRGVNVVREREGVLVEIAAAPNLEYLPASIFERFDLMNTPNGALVHDGERWVTYESWARAVEVRP